MRMKNSRYAAAGAAAAVQRPQQAVSNHAAPPRADAPAQAAGPSSSLAPIDPSSLEHCKVHPRLLESNSTSHTWAFGALAELVDNAQDREARAKTVWISGEYGLECIGGKLVVQDDGVGMTRAKLVAMLGLGFSNKEHVAGNVGRFGIGFKSGSMRLGKDVVVLTRERSTVSLAMLSQTFLKEENADDILIPMLTWSIESGGRLQRQIPTDDAHWEWAEQAMTKYSFLRSSQDIMHHVRSLKSTGTLIAIYNLRQPREFDFTESDVVLRRADAEEEGGSKRHYQQQRDGQQATLDVPEDYSLRSYLEVLYLEPQVDIWLQGQPVDFRNPLEMLQLQQNSYGPYNPKIAGTTGSIMCYFGYHINSGKLCGTHIYHKNRLIRMWQRHGSQLQNNCMMKDMLGVAVADCLTPTHNKQDFDTSTLVYQKFAQHLVKCMNKYYFEFQTIRSAGKVERRETKKKAKKSRNNHVLGVRPVEDFDEPELTETEDEEEDEEEDDDGGPQYSKIKRSRRQMGKRPAEKKEPPQDDWKAHCKIIWRTVYQNQWAPAFREPVDVVAFNIPDYYDKVKSPMDLGTMKQKLDLGKYSAAGEFRKDMLQIFKNCAIYNGINHAITAYAMKLQAVFNREWKKRQLPEELDETDEQQGPGEDPPTPPQEEQPEQQPAEPEVVDLVEEEEEEMDEQESQGGALSTPGSERGGARGIAEAGVGAGGGSDAPPAVTKTLVDMGTQVDMSPEVSTGTGEPHQQQQPPPAALPAQHGTDGGPPDPLLTAQLSEAKRRETEALHKAKAERAAAERLKAENDRLKQRSSELEAQLSMLRGMLQKQR